MPEPSSASPEADAPFAPVLQYETPASADVVPVVRVLAVAGALYGTGSTIYSAGQGILLFALPGTFGASEVGIGAVLSLLVGGVAALALAVFSARMLKLRDSDRRYCIWCSCALLCAAAVGWLSYFVQVAEFFRTEPQYIAFQLLDAAHDFFVPLLLVALLTSKPIKQAFR